MAARCCHVPATGTKLLNSWNPSEGPGISRRTDRHRFLISTGQVASRSGTISFPFVPAGLPAAPSSERLASASSKTALNVVEPKYPGATAESGGDSESLRLSEWPGSDGGDDLGLFLTGERRSLRFDVLGVV